MATKWQRVRIAIPKTYSPTERIAIGEEIVRKIRERTLKGIDKDNEKFHKYSKAYAGSLNFKLAGKSKSNVNLKLSGDMLASLAVLSHSAGSVMVGFENGTTENGKADGNIRGTYGHPTPIGPGRDFLGLPKKEIDAILSKYPRDDKEESLSRAQEIIASVEGAEDIIDGSS